jgi:hypothetical protein
MSNNKFNLCLIDNIRNQLRTDNSKYRESGKYINGLRCPACGKVEAFAHRDKPFAIICHRNNKCGVTTNIKDVYPHLFERISTDYPSTQENPTATARAYLESRGLNPDSFSFGQGIVTDDGKRYQTVTIEQDGVIFQRLIDYKGKDKNRTNSYKGKVYQTKSVASSDEVFVVEGVFDALALEQAGIAAIATYGSGSVPDKYYSAHKDKTFILAFDNDIAGKKAVEKTAEVLTKLGVIHKVALPTYGKDWNDLLLSGHLAKDKLESTLNECYWQGKLATAQTPDEYFEIHYNRYHVTPLIFEFDEQTYKGVLVRGKMIGSCVFATCKILDCTVKLLHSVIDDSVENRQHMTHYLETYSKREGSGVIKMDATEIAQAHLFKSAIAHQRLIFSSPSDLELLVAQLFWANPPKIRELSVIGYDAKSKCYIFPEFGYTQKGERIKPNEHKYFDTIKIKPFTNCSDTITKELEDIKLTEFVDNLYTAFGNKGLLALGFYIATLFSHMLFEKYGFFPFLSLYGDSHTGKSFISKLLNRCLFVDSEGHTMTTANTTKGELRKISQKSNLVCALLEGRKDKSRFDYDSILPLYNRNSLYSRATTSQDNRTHDLKLQTSLSFVWNHECFTAKPAKERVISIHFSEKNLSDVTAKALTKLSSYSSRQLASIGHFLLINRGHFEKLLVGNTEKFIENLKKSGVSVMRIAENHAMPLAGVLTFLNLVDESFSSDLLSYKTGLVTYTAKLGKTKIETAHSESHLADYFFESIASFSTADGVATNKEGELVIHLPRVLIRLQKDNNGFTNKAELIGELKRHDRFVGIKTSRCFGTPSECFHFKVRDIVTK